jgi:hypothetical protein
MGDKCKNQLANHNVVAERNTPVGWVVGSHKCSCEGNHTCSRDLMYGISRSRVDERQAPGKNTKNHQPNPIQSNSIQFNTVPIRSDPRFVRDDSADRHSFCSPLAGRSQQCEWTRSKWSTILKRVTFGGRLRISPNDRFDVSDGTFWGPTPANHECFHSKDGS